VRSISRRRFLEVGVGGAALAGVAARGAPAFGEERPAEKVRVGFIGVGGRGTTHLKKMLELENVDVNAICDIDLTNLERARKLVGDARGGKQPAGYQDYREVLASREIDAVLSALPCDLHAKVYLDTIAAGKDLYAEKPMCITKSECDAVVKAAEDSKLVMVVGFQRRFSPRIQEGIRRIHAGDAGDILEMRGSFLAAFGPLRGWFSKRARSGDWMVEQAVHVFDVMNWVFRSMPVSAQGAGRRDVFTANEPDRDVTDYYSAILEYPGGVIVNWLHSWVAPPGGTFDKHTCQVIGRKAAVDLYGGKIEFLDRKTPAETLPDDQGDLTEAAQRSFLDCVRKRRAGEKWEAPSGPRNGRDSVLTALLVRKAVDEKRLVKMEEVLSSSD
jgi:myo-inositol 2-dehydrogenase/D-chiro-inositol 1-dehydrogenase